MKANIQEILRNVHELNPGLNIEYFTDAFLNVDADFYSLLSFALKRNNEEMLNYLINIAVEKKMNISDINILQLVLKKDDLNNEILKKLLNLTDKKTILEIFPYYLSDRKGEYTKETSILLNHLEENKIRIDDDKILKDLLKFNLTIRIYNS